ncbi:DUF4124 domain-containing protein [Pseudomaricurvus alkylphenolicus]|jgi:hypothetical protein|uniref:DUF4124 domain-containing protein n=1 Tax=Pseudomaricurvus alkylphenolicus TaxID=1306991 RepID=UPI00141F3F8A|nr:DUF4124 domain-containing protein [Pseudomaricurvus alkylphenolicus]NIB39569.1 DUF4124 domain-containing protein [Pseudomaricurvus alkylphenolicus]
MKWMIKSMLLILVVGLVAPFFLKRPDGQPWMTINPDWYPSALWQRLTGGVNQALPDFSGDSSAPTRVYKWRDKDGSWRYSDTPPEGIDAQSLDINPDTNLIQGLPQKQSEQQKKSQPATDNDLPGVPLPLTVSPDQVQKMMDDARNVQQLMDQRSEMLEQQ